MSAHKIQLGEVCEFVRGITFPSGEGKPQPFTDSVACLTTSGVQQEIAWQSRRFVRRERVGSDRQMLRVGDILISTANSKELVGKSCIVNRSPFPCTFGAFVTVARPSEKIDPAYLAYWMSTPSFLAWCFKSSSNTTNISNLRVSELEEVACPLPDLPEQKRIAGLLEQADRLRRTRRYALELSDTFLPAAFLQLFGDPVRNTKGWSCAELGDIGAVERGKFTPRPRNDPTYFSGKFPFIQTGDITNSKGRLNSWTQTLNEKGVDVSRSFPAGAIVIAIVGATIGMTAILELEVYCPDSVVGIQVDPTKGEAVYLEMLLRFWRPVFLAQAPETARANINLDTLRPLRIPLPPLAQQHHFAALVAQHERLRANQREALRQAEHLFQSLLHRVFTT